MRAGATGASGDHAGAQAESRWGQAGQLRGGRRHHHLGPAQWRASAHAATRPALRAPRYHGDQGTNRGAEGHLARVGGDGERSCARYPARSLTLTTMAASRRRTDLPLLHRAGASSIRSTVTAERSQQPSDAMSLPHTSHGFAPVDQATDAPKTAMFQETSFR